MIYQRAKLFVSSLIPLSTGDIYQLAKIDGGGNFNQSIFIVARHAGRILTLSGTEQTEEIGV